MSLSMVTRGVTCVVRGGIPSHLRWNDSEGGQGRELRVHFIEEL